MRKSSLNVTSILILLSMLLWPESGFAIDQNAQKVLKDHFKNPPVDCHPHTRWWWPGNPVSKEGITWELEQMFRHGIGGVEQITMQPVYEKGNIPYMSETFLEMIKHTVSEAKRLGMEVSLNFGGPGWIIGGDWVPKEDRMKDMVPTSLDLVGPQTFRGPLPTKLHKTNRSWEHYTPFLDGDEKLLAVVAGHVIEDRLEEKSLIVLTPNMKNNTLEWEVPKGHWRVMAFWLKYTEQGVAVDHFNKAAMQRYCDYVGGEFYQVIGEEFGKTVDSFFCDSFELANSASGVYWSTGLLDEFEKVKGYDLTPYLPAIWWDVDEISPKIRYDVNDFLHHAGLDAFFNTFLGWCEAHGVKGRIQAYGFTTDNLEASGVTHIPELEITPGEKDAAHWFDNRIGPKKYVASGAHIYGRNVVSVEAYTYMHWERYRATLEELKIISDGFLRSGANKFYNCGYSYSPERDIAPSRTLPWAACIHPTNVWWDYYPILADYISRCSYLLRQGDFAPDVAIYSPLANQWTLDVLNPRKWTREFYWGDLGKLLIASGYDFDLLNDDALQNLARIEDGKIKIRNMEYKVLLLPNISALPLESMQFIKRYVSEGGTVIALERIPDFSTGFDDYEQNDVLVRNMAQALFEEPRGMDGTGPKNYGKGHTYFIKQVINRQIWWDWRSSVLDPFVNTLRGIIAPDFAIDFAYEGLRENNGLTFMHRKLQDADIYFVTNIQDKRSTIPVTFRVKNRSVFKWDPYNGEISQVFCYEEQEEGIKVPLNLAPYESMFLVFESDKDQPHVEKTNLYDIVHITDDAVNAIAVENGPYRIQLAHGHQSEPISGNIAGIPAPLTITGKWKMTLEGKDFSLFEKQLTFLEDWTKDPNTTHFSGTGRYEIDFDVPAHYIAMDHMLELDMGKVGNIAKVDLNGVDVGTIWMREQRLDITSAVHAGKNHLVLLVTNTLINRVSAFKEALPVPDELISRFGRGTTAYSSRIPGEFGFRPLPASGLMGPVKIRVIKNIQIPIN